RVARITTDVRDVTGTAHAHVIHGPRAAVLQIRRRIHAAPRQAVEVTPILRAAHVTDAARHVADADAVHQALRLIRVKGRIVDAEQAAVTREVVVNVTAAAAVPRVSRGVDALLVAAELISRAAHRAPLGAARAARVVL